MTQFDEKRQFKRNELISQAYARDSLLTIENPDYLETVRVFTTRMVEEDVKRKGDITADSILEDNNPDARARLISRGSGIIAGIEEATWFYNQLGITVETAMSDGEGVGKDQNILILTGKAKDLLVAERTGLNLLQRMSGIATLTGRLIEKVRDSNLKIAATRKTHWGALDNKAVAIGGGLTHRLGLWESILIKENHLSIFRKNGYEEDYIGEALERAWKWPEKNFIEIEVETKREAIRAAEKFHALLANGDEIPCIIMFDNFSINELKSVMEEMNTAGYFSEMLFEVSGQITPDNIADFASTGVDIASMGFLTHSPKALDISQLIEFE